jgi:hypothetical protein
MPLALFALLFPFPDREQREADPLEAALGAAQRREDRLKTLMVVWKVTEHIPKGGRMEVDPVGLPLPRDDQTWESRHVLLTDGARFRLLIQPSPWQPDRPDVQFAFDGVRHRARHFMQGPKQPALLVLDKPGPADLSLVTVEPITLWCRGVRWRADARARAEAGESAVKADGTRWREFRHRFDSYWLDVDHDYALRRIERRLDGATEVVDVTYADHPAAGWAPRSWTETRTRPDGKVARTARAEVTDLQVDVRHAPGTFRLDPSPGDTVVDHQIEKMFRVRSDLSLEEIDPAGEPAPRTEDEPKPLPAWPARYVVRALVIGGLVVVLLAALVLRRRPRPPHTPSP